MKRFCLFLFGAFLCLPFVHSRSLDYGNLFDDIKKYKKTEGQCHAGHLYEHMVWVAKAMNNLFDVDSKWTHGFDASDKSLLVIAAFMHDIGKAGDGQYAYLVKTDHPRVGFEYLLNKRTYTMESGTTYNFDAWCNQMNLAQNDRAALAVLVAMHQEFALTLRAMKNDPATTTQAFDEFITKLEGFVHEAGYNGGVPDERIMRMCFALCRADLEGMFRVDGHITDFPELEDHPETLDAVPIASRVVMDTAGYVTAQALLSYFKRKVYAYQPLHDYKA